MLSHLRKSALTDLYDYVAEDRSIRWGVLAVEKPVPSENLSSPLAILIAA